MQETLKKLSLPKDIATLIQAAPSVIIPESREQLLSLSMNGKEDICDISFDVPGMGTVREATVTKAKNGIVVNYDDPYLRRRDPNCMLIADDKPTDKVRYSDRFGQSFDSLRQETFDWLSTQDLIVMPFMSGDYEVGVPSLLVTPLNTAFFAGGLADLQCFIDKAGIPDGYKPEAIMFIAPPFRHTHFDGKQMVIHNRLDDMYEMYAYNLYPGPSAKKGAYGVLINKGEQEDWVTLHGSSVSVITPYDNSLNILHEGASGGGKSEMAERIHRDEEGQILVAKHTVDSSSVTMTLRESCEIRPLTDDMALCHPQYQKGSSKLVVSDAEHGWFLRTDGITEYGTDPYLERLTIHPKEPLIFLNYETTPGSTCLIWEHIMDAPGKPCPNPRVIMPRRFIPNIINEPMEIDVRSFGVRMPACTKENPTYGIIGMLHVLPPALAWLWRLVSPRGFANPSITETDGMGSEGVGSYWPFATGKRVRQANLLLDQFINASSTRYILLPNQHVGAYKVGFMPQWISREYLARRGSASFKPHMLVPSRATLLGYSVNSMKVDGNYIPQDLLQVNKQPDVGNDAYDKGAEILGDFFKSQLQTYLTEDLHPLGRKIIENFINDGPLNVYEELIPMRF